MLGNVTFPVVVFTKIDKQDSSQLAGIYRNAGLTVFEVNNMSGEGENAQVNWEKIFYERQLEKFLCYDSKILTDLFKLLKLSFAKFFPK